MQIKTYHGVGKVKPDHIYTSMSAAKERGKYLKTMIEELEIRDKIMVREDNHCFELCESDGIKETRGKSIGISLDAASRLLAKAEGLVKRKDDELRELLKEFPTELAELRLTGESGGTAASAFQALVKSREKMVADVFGDIKFPQELTDGHNGIDLDIGNAHWRWGRFGNNKWYSHPTGSIEGKLEFVRGVDKIIEQASAIRRLLAPSDK